MSRPIARGVPGSPVTRVLLASARLRDAVELAAVRPYRRVERGRPETVRGYQTMRPSMDPRGASQWIPAQDWAKGQQIWEKKGEAAWQARGAAARQRDAEADKAADAAAARARLASASDAAADKKAAAGYATEVGGHKVQAVYTHPGSETALYDLGNGLHAEGKPGEPPGRVMRSETGLVPQELRKKGWSAISQRQQELENQPVLRQSGWPAISRRQQELAQIDKAGSAEHAAYGAAASSGIFSDDDLAQIRAKVDDLKAQLQEARQRAEEAHVKIRNAETAKMQEKLQRTGARAELALELSFTVGMLLFGAFSGGVPLYIAIAMAIKALPDAAKALAKYHFTDKETAIQRLLARPIHHAVLGVQAIRQRRAKEAAVSSLRRLREEIKTGVAAPEMQAGSPEIKAAGPVPGNVVALSRVSSAHSQTARVIRTALIYHGLPPEPAKAVADYVADRAQQECLKRLAEHALPGPRR